MMDDSVRLRVNRAEQEVEIAGSEAFVREFSAKIDELLGPGHTSRTSRPPKGKDAAPKGSATEKTGDVPSTFGGYLQRFPDSINNNDRVLIAGYFAQANSDDDSFKTGDANGLLLEQGIKVPNPANCVKRNRESKRVFNLAKGQYRVSQTGKQHLESLLSPSE